jgi:hypothetical protein
MQQRSSMTITAPEPIEDPTSTRDEVERRVDVGCRQHRVEPPGMIAFSSRLPHAA